MGGEYNYRGGIYKGRVGTRGGGIYKGKEYFRVLREEGRYYILYGFRDNVL